MASGSAKIGNSGDQLDRELREAMQHPGPEQNQHGSGSDELRHIAERHLLKLRSNLDDADNEPHDQCR